MTQMHQWTDRKLVALDLLLDDIKAENRLQLMKWGTQVRSCFEWICFLTEEVGETAEAISEAFYRGRSKESIYNEAIQVATLALKIAEMAREAHLDDERKLQAQRY